MSQHVRHPQPQPGEQPLGDLPPDLRPTWAEIDLDAIEHNMRTVCAALPAGAAAMAVVKADAYGHGAVPVARAALEGGATWLGVAILEEGAALRNALGPDLPILVLGYVPPAAAERAIEDDLRLTLYHMDLAEALSAASQRLGRPARVHVKVDTGMGRIGLQASEVPAFLQALRRLPGVVVEGLYSHLASADDPDTSYTEAQAEEFARLGRHLQDQGLLPPVLHLANSAAALANPAWVSAAAGPLALARVGIALYGLSPFGDQNASHTPGGRPPAPLRPALSWRARFSHVKQVPAQTSISYGNTFIAPSAMPVGTLPVGYADGFSRRWSNAGRVLVRGRAVPVIGRVCMDQTMVDLSPVWSDAEPVRVGEEAVLIGAQGGAAISADDWARQLGTIHYEITCLVGGRVPRVYRRGGRVLAVRPPLV